MIDWTKPLELMDGTPVRLETPAEMKGIFGGTNPDIHGDYWIVKMDGSSLPGDACQRPDTTKVRNRAEYEAELSCIELPEQPTLRDRFAMAALTGLCSHPDYYDRTWAEIAETAEGQADAMMEARK